MPYKRKSTKRTSKRRYKRPTTRKRRSGTKPQATRMRGPMKLFGSFAPFPPTYNCKMHYVETVTLTTDTAGVFGAGTTFRLNSLYDPNLTGTGHQPYGYDQMAALYKRYIVSGVKVHITFTDPSADGVAVGCMVQASGGAGALYGITPDIIKEQPLSWVAPVNNTGSQVKHFSQYFPLQKVEGLQKVQWIANEDQYGAAINANPSLCPTIITAAASDSG